MELTSSQEVKAVYAVEAAIKAQSAQIASGVTNNLADAGKNIDRAEFDRAVIQAAGALGVSSTAVTSKFLSDLFKKLDSNNNGIIRQGGANNEYQQSTVEAALKTLLSGSTTNTGGTNTRSGTTTVGSYTYDKAKVADSLESSIDSALKVRGFTPSGYLSKNGDLVKSWEALSSRDKGGYNYDKNLYAAWHYTKYGKAENRKFFTGGYTGPGGVFEEAGIVHKGEVVFSQADVARFGGWRAVEALRKGGISTKGPARSRSESTAVAGLQMAISDLKEGLRAIAKHTEKTARRVEYLERWDYDGMPGVRA